MAWRVSVYTLTLYSADSALQSLHCRRLNWPIVGFLRRSSVFPLRSQEPPSRSVTSLSVNGSPSSAIPFAFLSQVNLMFALFAAVVPPQLIRISPGFLVSVLTAVKSVLRQPRQVSRSPQLTWTLENFPFLISAVWNDSSSSGTPLPLTSQVNRHLVFHVIHGRVFLGIYR